MKALAPATIAVVLALGVGGCGDQLDDSCSGESFGTCGPYEYTVVTSATVEPPEAMPGDPETPVEVRVEYDSCGGDAPSPPRIAVKGRVTRSTGLGDSGSSLVVVDIATLRDDGSTFGDSEAGDGVIDATLYNPFFDLPPERTVTLIFEPRVNSCDGKSKEIEYTTGEQWEPPGGP